MLKDPCRLAGSAYAEPTQAEGERPLIFIELIKPVIDAALIGR
jgi:hypothetical protein